MVSLPGQVSEYLQRRGVALAIIGATLLSAALFGWHPRIRYLLLPAAAMAAGLVAWRPVLGIGALITFALLVPLQFGTGSEVMLNPTTLIVPGLVVLALAGAFLRKDLRLGRSRVNRPLLLFLGSAVLSLLVGNLLWDLRVPRSQNLTVVQVAQWAILAFSAAAFWLMAYLVRSPAELQGLTWLFLLEGGVVAVLRMVPGLGGLADQVATLASVRAPFWMLLAAVAGGQLLFHRGLKIWQRGYLVILMVGILYYVFVQTRSSASNWIGVAVALATLLWMRYPRLRVPVIVGLLILYPILAPRVYEFGGGDAEWEESGGSRMALIGRVASVTMRNPLLGLGPASYRAYAMVEPLRYGGALWFNPRVNSHNNYVDLFAHVGLLGLGLFAWFVWELARLCIALVGRDGGVMSGYVQSAFATLLGSLVLMMLADWILPFVYNIGFPGFQASVLVWLFLGGLLAVARWTPVAKTS